MGSSFPPSITSLSLLDPSAPEIISPFLSLSFRAVWGLSHLPMPLRAVPTWHTHTQPHSRPIPVPWPGTAALCIRAALLFLCFVSERGSPCLRGNENQKEQFPVLAAPSHSPSHPALVGGGWLTHPRLLHSGLCWGTSWASYAHAGVLCPKYWCWDALGITMLALSCTTLAVAENCCPAASGTGASDLLLHRREKIHFEHRVDVILQLLLEIILELINNPGLYMGWDKEPPVAEGRGILTHIGQHCLRQRVWNWLLSVKHRKEVFWCRSWTGAENLYIFFSSSFHSFHCTHKHHSFTLPWNKGTERGCQAAWVHTCFGSSGLALLMHMKL